MWNLRKPHFWNLLSSSEPRAQGASLLLMCFCFTGRCCVSDSPLLHLLLCFKATFVKNLNLVWIILFLLFSASSSFLFYLLPVPLEPIYQFQIHLKAEQMHPISRNGSVRLMKVTGCLEGRCSNWSFPGGKCNLRLWWGPRRLFKNMWKKCWIV